MTINGEELDSTTVKPESVASETQAVVYQWTIRGHHLVVRYELRPDWRFISKQIICNVAGTAQSNFESVEVMHGTLESDVGSELVVRSAHTNLGCKDTVAFVRSPNDSHSLFLLVQNPFFEWERHGRDFYLSYKPEMNWQSS